MSYTTIPVTPGSGANVNVDRIGGNDFQRFKLSWGVQGSAVDVSSSDPFPIQDTNQSTYHLITDGTDSANIKSTGGIVRGVLILNTAAYPIYIKFHNTGGTPTPGSGVVMTVPVQAGFLLPFTFPGRGKAFATGIGITVVKDAADAGSTPVAAGDGVIEVFYE